MTMRRVGLFVFEDDADDVFFLIFSVFFVEIWYDWQWLGQCVEDATKHRKWANFGAGNTKKKEKTESLTATVKKNTTSAITCHNWSETSYFKSRWNVTFWDEDARFCRIGWAGFGRERVFGTLLVPQKMRRSSGRSRSRRVFKRDEFEEIHESERRELIVTCPRGPSLLFDHLD